MAIWNKSRCLRSHDPTKLKNMQSLVNSFMRSNSAFGFLPFRSLHAPNDPQINPHPTEEARLRMNGQQVKLNYFASLGFYLIVQTQDTGRSIGRFVNASAIHPATKLVPPRGVTGPRNLYRCGSRTSKYILPENIVMPTVKRPAAILFLGASAEETRRTPECIN